MTNASSVTDVEGLGQVVVSKSLSLLVTSCDRPTCHWEEFADFTSLKRDSEFAMISFSYARLARTCFRCDAVPARYVKTADLSNYLCHATLCANDRPSIKETRLLLGSDSGS